MADKNRHQEKTELLEQLLADNVYIIVQSTLASLNIKPDEMTQEQMEQQAEQDMEKGASTLISIVENFVHLGLTKGKAVKIAYQKMEQVTEQGEGNE